MASFASTWTLLRNEGGEPPYLLLDASGIEGGRSAIPEEAFDELECLFTGDLAEELADVGPYLARLKSWEDSEASIAGELLRSEAGMLAVLGKTDSAAVSFAEVHRHFRKFNVVYAPDSTPVFFRYYDPRVLPSVLKVLDPGQLLTFFGPVRQFVAETRRNGLVQASLLHGKLSLQD